MNVLKAFEVPLTPEADEARDLLRGELSKSEYQEQGKSWFDLLSEWLWGWISSLQAPDGAGNLLLITLVTLAIIGVIIAAFLVFGKPRLNRRSGYHAIELFGENETRGAEQLRKDAAKAASQQSWNDAVILQFRAIARAMIERTVLSPSAGTTAQMFVHQLSASFPAQRSSLLEAATSFDQVRYLERAGSGEDYELLRQLDHTLSQSSPSRFDQMATPS